MKFQLSNNVPNPFTESLDAFGDGGRTKKENEADKFCHQQDKELSPMLAVGGIDAAAEDIEHQRGNDVAGQREQPLGHQCQKRYKERNWENHHLKQKPHIEHLPFFSPLL